MLQIKVACKKKMLLQDLVLVKAHSVNCVTSFQQTGSVSDYPKSGWPKRLTFTFKYFKTIRSAPRRFRMICKETELLQYNVQMRNHIRSAGLQSYRPYRGLTNAHRATCFRRAWLWQCYTLVNWNCIVYVTFVFPVI